MLFVLRELVCILIPILFVVLQEVTLSFNEIRSSAANIIAESMENKDKLIKLELDGMYVY